MRVARYLLSGGIARCTNCGGPLTAAPDRAGIRRYRCNRNNKGNCARGVSAVMADLDQLVADRFLTLAGDLAITEEIVIEERPDYARRTDLIEAIRQAERAMTAADDADDEHAFAAARTTRRALRDELADLPAEPTMHRERIRSTETYRERFDRLDTAGRRELLAPLVTVIVDNATARTATGHYDNSRAALGARVRTLWSGWLEEAGIAAAENAAYDAAMAAA